MFGLQIPEEYLMWGATFCLGVAILIVILAAFDKIEISVEAKGKTGVVALCFIVAALLKFALPSSLWTSVSLLNRWSLLVVLQVVFAALGVVVLGLKILRMKFAKGEPGFIGLPTNDVDLSPNVAGSIVIILVILGLVLASISEPSIRNY